MNMQDGMMGEMEGMDGMEEDPYGEEMEGMDEAMEQEEEDDEAGTTFEALRATIEKTEDAGKDQLV